MAFVLHVEIEKYSRGNKLASPWISKGSHVVHESTKSTSDERLVSNATSRKQSASDELCLRDAEKINRAYTDPQTIRATRKVCRRARLLRAFIHLNSVEGRASLPSLA